MSDEQNVDDTPETDHAMSISDETAYDKSKQLERERNAALRRVRELEAKIEQILKHTPAVCPPDMSCVATDGKPCFECWREWAKGEPK